MTASEASGSLPTIEDLRETLAGIGPLVVAFSGGVDSALLAWAANEVAGEDALCVTAVSPSLAGDEAADCDLLAAEWGLRWQTVETHEMEDAAYRVNDADRCFWCKSALMDALAPLAAERGATVALGVNLDDLGEVRPGQQAAAERGARFPLVEAGFTKSDIRRVSAELGLRTADKPAAACLASRIPYGTPVSVPLLDRLDRAEAALRRLGFGQLRVRHYGETARIELPDGDLAAAVERRGEIVTALTAVGYRYVTLDLEGFRSGNLNHAVATAEAANEALDPAAALRAIAARLAEETTAALPEWVRRCVAEACERGAVAAPPSPESVEGAARRCASQVGPELAALLAQDPAEQRSTPLAIVRAAVRFPTEVLAEAGIREPERDDFATERFGDDVYDLVPASMADISPELGPLAMAWGAAKAAELIRRADPAP